MSFLISDIYEQDSIFSLSIGYSFKGELGLYILKDGSLIIERCSYPDTYEIKPLKPLYVHKTLTPEDIDNLMKKLKSLGLFDWEKAPGASILDGTHWWLTVAYGDIKVDLNGFFAEGGCPDRWDEIIKVLEKIVGKKFI